MHLPFFFSSLVAVVCLSLSTSVSADSAPARPLKRADNPSTLALEILPRRADVFTGSFNKRLVPASSNTLRHDDSFRLMISTFNETYHLHLRPNMDLVHPAARITYYTTSSDGKSHITHSEPLLRESVKAYWGEVIAAEHSSSRMREDAAGVISPAASPDLGWARILVHHQGDVEMGIAPEFEGAFAVHGVVHHIMTKDNYLRLKAELDPEVSPSIDQLDSGLVIWRDSDVMTPEEERVAKRSSLQSQKRPSCGHDRLPYNTDPAQNSILRRGSTVNPWYANPLGLFGNETLSRRDDVGSGNSPMGSNFIDMIGSSDGCSKTQKVLFMGVAADCTYTSRFGSQDNATRQILTNWNTASALYKSTFNVSLGIVEIQVQNPTCPTTADSARPWNVACSDAELDTRLSLFSQWRGAKGDDGTGLWHLMSNCPTGSEVGIAWLATLCQQDATGNAPSVVSGTAVSTAGRTEWQVVAHEIGHNFGAIHDCGQNCKSTDMCCPLTGTGTCDAKSQFLMSPVAQVGEQKFSPCTLGNICSVMRGVTGGKTNTSCLVDPDPNRQTISLQMCGNGIVEKGEDCDPGKGMESACCDASTCKFKPGAVCDPQSSPCCTAQCSFAPPTQVCRPSRDSRCDMAEMCTGNSSSCPTDIVAPNGQSCGSNDLKCASGLCTSVSQQCQTIGASMGLKQACPNRGDNTCQVSCQDPSKPNQCILLNSLLIDGSPCGYGGMCVGGKCQSAGFLDTAKAWYTQNLQISIPVTVVAGLIAILLLWALARVIARCCSRPRRASTFTAEPRFGRNQMHERLNSYDRNAANRSDNGIREQPIPTFLQAGNPINAYNLSTRQGPVRHGARPWVDDRLYNGPRER